MLLIDSTYDEQPGHRFSVKVEPIFYGNMSCVCVATGSNLQHFTGLYGYGVTENKIAAPMKDVFSETVINYIPFFNIHIVFKKFSCPRRCLCIHCISQSANITLYGRYVHN